MILIKLLYFVRFVGNFSCEPSAAEIASVAVRVLSANAEPAAMQHERSGKRSAAPNLGNGVSNLSGMLSICMLSFYMTVLYHFNKMVF